VKSDQSLYSSKRLPNALCDHSRVVIDGECHDALEAAGARDKQTESALERVGSNPCFIRRADVFATQDNGRFDVFSAMARDTFNVEKL
jgi:hypothetical protein